MKPKTQNIKSTKPATNFIYMWEGLIFNLLCAFYFVFLEPFITEISVETFHNEQAFSPWFGTALIFIFFLEIYAFPKKMKYVHKTVMDQGKKINHGIILWMFHTVISISFMFMIFESFGFSPGDLTWWMSMLLFIVIIKELYFLFSMIGLHDETDTLEKYKRPNKKEWLIDLILILYACMAYTVTWQTILNNTNMEKHNLPMYILNIFITSLLFLMFYMPLRIPYYLEEITQLKTNKDIVKFILSIFLVLISAISAL